MHNKFHNNLIEKDFASWMRMKERIHKKERDILFHAQEVWWCSLGANVGVEADGKNTLFERPVVVFRKLNSEMFWALPLTSKMKDERPYHFKLTLQNRPQVILLSQMRVLSTKRLIRRLTSLSQNASSACGENECDMKSVSPEGDSPASTNARFRPRNAPSACCGNREADVFTKLSDREFASLGECMYAYIQKTDPLRGPQVPNGNNEHSVSNKAEPSIPAVKSKKPQ